MSLPWLFLLQLNSLLVLCTEHTTQMFGSSRVTTLGNQTVYPKQHDPQSSPQNNGKLVKTSGATRQLIVTEEYKSGENILQTETTASETLTSPSTQRGNLAVLFTDQTNLPGENVHPITVQTLETDSDTDMCILSINQVQKQHGLVWENQTISNTCKSERTSFESELVSSGLVCTARFVTQDIVIPTIAFPGCVFNIISIHLLVKQGTESSSTRYLIALGVADLCYLVLAILNWIIVLLKEYQYVFYVSTRLFLIYASLQFYLLLLTGRYSNLLVLLLSLDRFIAVKFPLRAKNSPLSRHPVKLSLALFVFLTVLLIPIFWRVEFPPVNHFNSNKSELVMKSASFSHSKTIFFTSYSFISVVTFRLLPVLLTFVFNIAIILVMKVSKGSPVATHVTDEKRQQRELKITRMLVTISLIFLICATPGLLHVVIFNIYPVYSSAGPYRNIYLIVSHMFPILDAINSTVNFFVYVLLSKRFRVIFMETFCHRLSRDTTMETSEVQISN